MNAARKADKPDLRDDRDNLGTSGRKDDTLDDVERAVSAFVDGFSCAQAVLSTFGPRFGLDRDTALRIASSFGGGMGRQGYTCGAVTGALMAIGLCYGRTASDDEEAKEKTYGLAREFIEKFKARNGSTVCKELLEFDISTPEGLKQLRERNIFDTVCTKLVREAAAIIEELL